METGSGAQHFRVDREADHDPGAGLLDGLAFPGGRLETPLARSVQRGILEQRTAAGVLDDGVDHPSGLRDHETELHPALALAFQLEARVGRRWLLYGLRASPVER